ncbi:MAG TPA: c-type cytochrome [Acidiferrobacter sp.]|nr:c-type cytochrome [Acidiferrobacter sp.]
MRRALALVLAASWLSSAQAGSAPMGKRIALLGVRRVQACANCHGAQGQGRRHFWYPRLAGLGAPYLLDALRSFADGRRLNGIMTPIARALSPREMRAVVHYYAAFRPRPPAKARYERVASLAVGRDLYEHGDLADKVLPCARCHGLHAEGMGAQFPRLAGQSRAYVIEQLRAFRAGARIGLGLMREAARPLNDRQIADIASYLSMVGVRPPLVFPRLSPEPSTHYRVERFVPPRRAAVPTTPFGKAVLRGRALFNHTGRYAPRYVRNALSCRDCHLAEGRMAGAGPMWAAAALYPQLYERQVVTLAVRMQAAFVHSENGRPPSLGGPVLTDLLAYVHWMSRGERIGVPVVGRGYPSLAKPAHPPSAVQGAALYAHSCAVCHGAHGQGVRRGRHWLFPPVWGSASYGVRSSLARVPMLAAFLAATMPYGKPGSLTPAQAYDLATYLKTRPRPH